MKQLATSTETTRMVNGPTSVVRNDGLGEDIPDSDKTGDYDAVYTRSEGEPNNVVEVEKVYVGGRARQTGRKTFVRDPLQEERAHGQVAETLGRGFELGYHGDEWYNEEVEWE